MSTEDSFESFKSGVTPLKQDKVRLQTSAASEIALAERRAAAARLQRRHENYLTDNPVPSVDPLDVLSFKLDGLQTGVFKKLRQGKYPIEGHLDLHRHTVAEARTALYRFIQQSLELDCRTVLVTHGKGAQSNPPARIKSYVNYWLTQVPEVMAFHSASAKHGGVGSVYVLLKKSSEKKQQNRELHRS